MRRAFKPLVLWTVVGLMYGCTTESDDGLCKLDCKNAVIGDQGYEIKALTPDITLKCAPNQGNAYNFQITSKFGVFRKRDSGNGLEAVAVPGVAIQPVINGLVNRSVESDGIEGLLTEQSNFCSDQCGVVTVQYSGLCIPEGDGEIQAYVMSGSLTSEPSVVTVESATYEPEPTATATPTP